MIFRAGNMLLKPVREVFTGAGSRVCVCRDLSSPQGAFYTLLAVTDRALAKRLVSVFDRKTGFAPNGEPPYILHFTQNALLCYVFAYRAERKIALFAPGQITTGAAWESVCVNLVMECLASPLPFPLLSLALEQGHVHLDRDGSVFITPHFDLSGLSEDDDEAVCARRCVELMLSLPPVRSTRLKSAELMRKKLEKGAFKSLPELYRDIRITKLPRRKKWSERLNDLRKADKTGLFRLLLILCGISAVFALIVLVSQIFFGNVPFFRLFESCFDLIGERSLK